MENLQAAYSVRQAAYDKRDQPSRASSNVVGGDLANPIVVILCVGLVAEIILPWAAIWLSDALFFDIPAWSLWLLFGVSPAFSLVAILMHWAWMACAKHLSGPSATGWRDGIGGALCCH
jgi:hypothetical protein